MSQGLCCFYDVDSDPLLNLILKASWLGPSSRQMPQGRLHDGAPICVGQLDSKSAPASGSGRPGIAPLTAHFELAFIGCQAKSRPKTSG